MKYPKLFLISFILLVISFTTVSNATESVLEDGDPAIEQSLPAVSQEADLVEAATSKPELLYDATSTDYIVIIGYLLLTFALGYSFRKFNKNSNDYFRGGNRAVWWMVGSSSFMTAFSAWTFTGAASQAYQSGFSIAVIFIANTIGFTINALFLAGWYRQTRATTLPEILRKRFNIPTQQFYAWVGVIFSYLMAGLHLWGISIFTSTLFGFDITTIIVILGISVVLYSTIGGNFSVLATDFVQTLILIPLTLVTTILALKYIGGFSGFFSEIHAQGLQNHLRIVEVGPAATFTVIYILAVGLKQIMVYNGLNDAPKYFSVKDGTDARKAAALAGCLMFLGAMFWFIPPIVAKLRFSHIVDNVALANPADSAYAVAALQLLPPGVVGLLAVAMFSATSSSMDSSLNRNSAIFTRDIVKGLLFKNITEKSQFIIGQIFTLISGVIVISLALYFANASGRGIFEMMMRIGGLVAIPKLVPLLWGLFVKRSPHWVALASMSAGFAMSVAAMINGWAFPRIIFSNFAIGTFVFFASTLLFPAKGEYKKRVDEFFKVMRTPVDFEKEVGGAIDTMQLHIIGRAAVIMSVAIALLIFIAGIENLFSVMFISGFIGIIGVVFLVNAKKIQKKQDALLKTADVKKDGEVVAEKEEHTV